MEISMKTKSKNMDNGVYLDGVQAIIDYNPPQPTAFTSLRSGSKYEVELLRSGGAYVSKYGSLSGQYIGSAIFDGASYTDVQDAVNDLINYFDRGGTLNFER